MRKLLIIILFVFICRTGAFAQDADSLMVQAKSLVDLGRSNEAAAIFEKIMSKDSTNYESYVFLGNYYYLLGEKATKKVDSAFSDIFQPTRMQMAHYQDDLKAIYYTHYVKADLNLKKALEIAKNDHLEKLVASIQTFRKKIGLASESGKKKVKVLAQRVIK